MSTVTIIPDTPAKRREYEEEIVRTFYLSNADLKETIDLLRIVVDARRICPDHGDQRDHHQGHARADRPPPRRIISAIDKARPEVIIDVELLEVDRTRLRSTGCRSPRRARPGHRRGRPTSTATASRCATCAT
jgi:general secretion pathway protein D